MPVCGSVACASSPRSPAVAVAMTSRSPPLSSAKLRLVRGQRPQHGDGRGMTRGSAPRTVSASVAPARVPQLPGRASSAKCDRIDIVVARSPGPALRAGRIKARVSPRDSSASPKRASIRSRLRRCTRGCSPGRACRPRRAITAGASLRRASPRWISRRAAPPPSRVIAERLAPRGALQRPVERRGWRAAAPRRRRTARPADRRRYVTVMPGGLPPRHR